jgi:hypothetical protein
MSAVFTEYAWDMGFCDPCSSTPLTPEELRGLGVDWITTAGATFFPPRAAGGRGPAVSVPPRQQAFLTRLHVRYDNAHFPEDLVFQETGDRTNFQGRYVIRQAWTGRSQCPEAETYKRTLRERQEREAQTLVSLTGWNLDTIRRRMGLTDAPPVDTKPVPWWKGLWP